MISQNCVYSDSVQAVPLSAFKDGTKFSKVSHLNFNTLKSGDIVNLGELPLSSLEQLQGSQLSKLRFFISSADFQDEDLLHFLSSRKLNYLAIENNSFWCLPAPDQVHEPFHVSAETLMQIPRLEKHIELLEDQLLRKTPEPTPNPKKQLQPSVRNSLKKIALIGYKKFKKYIPAPLTPVLIAIWHRLSK